MSSPCGDAGEEHSGGRNSKFKDGNKRGTFIGSEASESVAERVRGGVGDEVREIRESLSGRLRTTRRKREGPKGFAQRINLIFCFQCSACCVKQMEEEARAEAGEQSLGCCNNPGKRQLLAGTQGGSRGVCEQCLDSGYILKHLLMDRK